MNQPCVISRISSLLDEVRPIEKRATEMDLSGSAKQDPGGYQGPSTHPSARAASNLQKTPLGSRAHENEADVKKDQPVGVDNTSPKSGGSQDDKQFHIGMHPSATGEDPKVEDNYRLGKKDDKRDGDRGGTEGPFSAEKVPDEGMPKSAALIKLAYDKLNNIITGIATGELEKLATSHVTSLSTATAAAAGAELANAAGSMDKRAAAYQILENAVRDAELNADLVRDFLTKYAYECERLKKLADDGTMGGPMGGAMEGESAMPPPPPGGPPGAGGPPMPPPGADPTTGGPPGAGGDPGAGGGGEEAHIDEIINALLQQGATPEDIIAAVQQDAGGGAGGPPGADGGTGAGAPPMPGGEPGAPEPKTAAYHQQLLADKHNLVQLCKQASVRFRNGQWKARPVAPGTKEAQDREALVAYIVEVCRAR